MMGIKYITATSPRRSHDSEKKKKAKQLNSELDQKTQENPSSKQFSRLKVFQRTFWLFLWKYFLNSVLFYTILHSLFHKVF